VVSQLLFLSNKYNKKLDKNKLLNLIQLIFRKNIPVTVSIINRILVFYIVIVIHLKIWQGGSGVLSILGLSGFSEAFFGRGLLKELT
jgi:hypothetical protein